MLLSLFPGFKPISITTRTATINGVMGGSGPPLLLLHGWPQSRLEWRHIAPRLARHFTVIATDLRGYGESSKPADTENHVSYCKRTMAADQAEVMNHLGFDRFAVVGHDRGGRVAYRMALDFPAAITRLCLLDIVPTLTVYSTVNKQLATAYFHWFLLIQPAPLPETLLAGRGEALLKSLFQGLTKQALSDEVLSEYIRYFNDPATLHAMCEDYRAAATIDLEHDSADLHRKVECPMLILWGQNGPMHKLYNVLDTWLERGTNVTGKSLPGGHWLPEEIPDSTLQELHQFMSQGEEEDVDIEFCEDEPPLNSLQL